MRKQSQVALPVNFSGRQSEVGFQGVPHQLRLIGAVVAPGRCLSSSLGSWYGVFLPLDTVHDSLMKMHELIPQQVVEDAAAQGEGGCLVGSKFLGIQKTSPNLNKKTKVIFNYT